MDARNELTELIRQAREHLIYYRELGLTHIGQVSHLTFSETTMSKQEKTASQGASLFGEISAPSLEEQFVNETLDDIRRDLGDCKRCKLWSTRKQIGFAEGKERADRILVGEGPGAVEYAGGSPS